MTHVYLEPGEVIGVAYRRHLTDLKRTLLLVDRMGIFIPASEAQSSSADDPTLFAEIDGLVNDGLVFQLTVEPRNTRRVHLEQDGIFEVPAKATEVSTVIRVDGEAPPEIIQAGMSSSSISLSEAIEEYVCRRACAQLRNHLVEAVTLRPPRPRPQLDSNQIHAPTVLALTMRQLPVPDEMTSLERIIEFRRDPSAKLSLHELRQWMRKVQKADLSPVEIAQELEYLLTTYDQHMRLHDIKTKRSTAETVVTFVAESAEDLVKFKWGKLAQSLFALSRSNVALLEAEANAPGRGLSYVWKANREFGR